VVVQCRIPCRNCGLWFYSTWQTRHSACISGTLRGSYNTRRLRKRHTIAGSNGPPNSYYAERHYHAIHASKNKDRCETSPYQRKMNRFFSSFTFNMSVAGSIILPVLFYFWTLSSLFSNDIQKNIERLNFYWLNFFLRCYFVAWQMSRRSCIKNIYAPMM